MIGIIFYYIILSSALQAETYQHLSTSELEKKVELHSINGTLPFEMGLELIKRWSRSE
jgi:hypothetical protein